jgi:uncharacterized protein (TIGR00375 family)
VRFHADLHIHSKYSRACSRDCDLEHLSWWARRKGITLVGTGDFTHPAWFDQLRENLVPAQPGLFRLREQLDRDIVRDLPPRLGMADVRFMLSVEISTIYKRDDRTRKVHHLVYMPDFEAAARFNAALGRIGNLGSDGRPILGLDSRDLLEITLDSGDGSYLVPAHVWTPWFAVLGSKAGFDAVEDCYGDLAHHIFALETGLSSDPAMNWRVSALDKYRLVSNSDAHSPPILGREATIFDTELDYFAIRRALETGNGLAGTVEFFPEEGKYHVDGHRACGVRMEPSQTRRHRGMCPKCRKPMTVGVLSRVEELADRPEGFRPAHAADVYSLVPLPEIMGEILYVGSKSKAVLREIDKLTAALGPELAILETVPVEDIHAHSPLLAQAVARLRRGEVIRDAGYDGEYGVITLFEPGELKRLAVASAPALFDDGPSLTRELTEANVENEPSMHELIDTAEPTPRYPSPAAPAPAPPSSPPDRMPTGSLLERLDPEQRAAADIVAGPLLIVAGPGTGKTRTLTHRIANLVAVHGVAPEHCLAITFTRRAAEEMTQRLAVLVPDRATKVTITTFHAFGLRILREQHKRIGLNSSFGIADQAQQLAVAIELTGNDKDAQRLIADVSQYRRSGDAEPELFSQYLKVLRQRDLVDFDDLVTLPVELLESDRTLAAFYQARYRHVCVDEYQDVDEWQYRLLRQLVPPDGNIVAIGDPDQAIYRFRGADVGFFLRFGQDFPTARTVQLSRNYRSAPHILAAAQQVIATTSLVPDRDLLPMGKHGDALVCLHHAADEQAEASFVARTIEQILGGTSFHSFDSGRADSSVLVELDLASFAVLYRTDRQSNAIMTALTQAGLPFQKRSHDRLIDRPHVGQILDELKHPSVGHAATSSVLARLRWAADAVAGREAAIYDEAVATEIHAAVDILQPLANRCADNLERFRSELVLGVEVDTWDPRADRICLLTLHAAKGLEFPVVFLVGCEDGLLPLRWSQADPDEEDQVQEERRLLFVGMTRAQRHLFISHAAERSRHGNLRKVNRSPFLADLHPDVYERLGDTVPRKRARTTQLRLL